jgi:hypothetical protein
MLDAIVIEAERVTSIGDDLLDGAHEIAEFLFGDRRQRRRVYYLAESGFLPIFRLGSTICALRSTLRAWIAQQERNQGRGA